MDLIGFGAHDHHGMKFHFKPSALGLRGAITAVLLRFCAKIKQILPVHFFSTTSTAPSILIKLPGSFIKNAPL